jgi:hypothetical protein
MPRVYPALTVAASTAAGKAFSQDAGEAAVDAEAVGPEIATPAPAMIELFRKSRLDVDMYLP